MPSKIGPDGWKAEELVLSVRVFEPLMSSSRILMFESAINASTSLVRVVPFGAVLVWLNVICTAIPSLLLIAIVITSSVSLTSSA